MKRKGLLLAVALTLAALAFGIQGPAAVAATGPGGGQARANGCPL
jgi:hypothetical protein